MSEMDELTPFAKVATELGVAHAQLKYDQMVGKLPLAQIVVSGRQYFSQEEVDDIRQFYVEKAVAKQMRWETFAKITAELNARHTSDSPKIEK